MANLQHSIKANTFLLGEAARTAAKDAKTTPATRVQGGSADPAATGDNEDYMTKAKNVNCYSQELNQNNTKVRRPRYEDEDALQAPRANQVFHQQGLTQTMI